MTALNWRRAIKLGALALLLLALGAPAGADDRVPDLSECPELVVDDGNKVAFEATGIGVQIYRWDGTKWVFVAPEAVLFEGRSGAVAIHFAGPTWESRSGSTVVGSVVAKCTPDPDSIPWLKLTASSEGPGIFADVTFIQRLNTMGGIAPDEPGAFVGDEARVPYVAQYVFYRKK
jgi:hypothetical protein